jgi:hypothetical protein
MDDDDENKAGDIIICFVFLLSVSSFIVWQIPLVSTQKNNFGRKSVADNFCSMLGFVKQIILLGKAPHAQIGAKPISPSK